MEAIPEEPGAGGEMPSPEPALVTAAERNEIFRLVAASAVIGVISNFIWGGLFDTEGATGALLGGVLFSGWGMAESSGVLEVKWLGMPGGRAAPSSAGPTWA